MSKLIALLLEEEVQVSQMIGLPQESQMGPEIQPTATGTIDPEPNIAIGIMQTILAKAKEADAKLEDAVILYQTPKGETKIKQLKELTSGRGAKRGAFWGLVAGLILGGPIAGVLWGLGIGAVVGAKVDHGIDNKFLKGAADWLSPNHSAVLVLVKDEDAERAYQYLSTFDAEIRMSDLDRQAEEAADKAADNETIASAVQAEYGIE
jgi:uncharacterized membrane protein